MIFSLQLFVLPISPGNHSATSCRSAAARHAVIIIVGGCPIVRELFTRCDFAQRHKYDLALHADVRIAGMITEDHGAFSLISVARSDKEVDGDLNFRRP